MISFRTAQPEKHGNAALRLVDSTNLCYNETMDHEEKCSRMEPEFS